MKRILLACALVLLTALAAWTQGGYQSGGGSGYENAGGFTRVGNVVTITDSVYIKHGGTYLLVLEQTTANAEAIAVLNSLGNITTRIIHDGSNGGMWELRNSSGATTVQLHSGGGSFFNAGGVVIGATDALQPNTNGNKTLTFAESSGDPVPDANSGCLYVKDVSSVAEVFAIDDGANAAQLTPHNSNGDWVFFSFNRRTKQVQYANMEKALRVLEKLSGEKLFHEVTMDSVSADSRLIMEKLAGDL